MGCVAEPPEEAGDQWLVEAEFGLLGGDGLFSGLVAENVDAMLPDDAYSIVNVRTDTTSSTANPEAMRLKIMGIMGQLRCSQGWGEMARGRPKPPPESPGQETGE